MPCCLKVTMPLPVVNKTLKFSKESKIIAIFCRKIWKDFCSAKAPHNFSAKDIIAVDFVGTVRLNISSTNDNVKLTALWATWSWLITRSHYWLSKMICQHPSVADYIMVHKGYYRISSDIRRIFFSFQNNPKDLDPSYKMDLDLWDCLGRVKLVL